MPPPQPLRVLSPPDEPGLDELCVWIGDGPAPPGAAVVVGGRATAPWQQTLDASWAEPHRREELLAVGRRRRAVLSRYAVPRAEVFGEPRLLWLRSEVDRLDPAALLDVGCGIAYSTFCAANGRGFIGVDMDEGNLRHARGVLRGVPDVTLLHSEAGAVPLPDGSADCVLMTEILEHLHDESTALAEAWRVLRPGGHLLVTVPGLRFGIDSGLRLLPVRTVHDIPGPEFHVRPGYTRDSLRDLLISARFEADAVDWLVGPTRRALQDVIGLGHIAVQRLVHRRKGWNWSEASETEDSAAFGLYARLRPVMRRIASLDERLALPAGFQVVARARKPTGEAVDS
ncbi:MAG: class I SAM-dependent methyltransferase [Deltaproteobacteria bacterium]|nr:class I SAM-dependent methyltransferase [Deltaproteobacteria bacterium]